LGQHAPGIYVDAASGEPLFFVGSTNSGFRHRLAEFQQGDSRRARSLKIAMHLGVSFARSALAGADSHLGHVFRRRPTPTGLRYCIQLGGVAFRGPPTSCTHRLWQVRSTFEAAKIRSDAPDKEQALLAGGCFWGMQTSFEKIPGVVTSDVGYTGGTSKNPETKMFMAAIPTRPEGAKKNNSERSGVIIAIHTAKRTTRKRCASCSIRSSSRTRTSGWFFRMHDPTTKNRQGNDVGTQYRSAIFFADQNQRAIANA